MRLYLREEGGTFDRSHTYKTRLKSKGWCFSVQVEADDMEGVFGAEFRNLLELSFAHRVVECVHVHVRASVHLHGGLILFVWSV